MTVDRYLRLIAGTFVFASALLAAFHSPYWLFFTGFVGLNMAQSAFTNWCPMMQLLRVLGVPESKSATCVTSAPLGNVSGNAQP
jgi:hypothetical protein